MDEEMPVDEQSIEMKCVIAAEDFARSRDSSFEECQERLKKLKLLMEAFNDPQNQFNRSTQFLLAKSIAIDINSALTGKCKTSDQTVYANVEKDKCVLSQVLSILVQWSTEVERSAELKCATNSLRQLILDTILAWNKKLYAKPPISLIQWPRPSASCRGHYSGLYFPPSSSEFSVLINLDRNRGLVHATSTVNAVNILLKNADYITLCPSRPEVSNLVFCGLKITEEDFSQLPCRFPPKFTGDQRYGSVVFSFPINAATYRWSQAYILGTREYIYEYSQVIYISNKDQPHFECHLVPTQHGRDHNEMELNALTQVEFPGYEWTLSYGPSTHPEWTNPEVTFLGPLEIPKGQFKISFSSHECPSWKKAKCVDCQDQKGNSTREYAMWHFKKLLTHEKLIRFRNAFSEKDYMDLTQI